MWPLLVAGNLLGMPTKAVADNPVWSSLQGGSTHSDHWWGVTCGIQGTPTHCEFTLSFDSSTGG